MSFFSFPGTSKPLVNHNIFTNLDFLKSDLYLRVWANYWTICWGWGCMMTQGNSFATSHPCDVSAEFPQRAFWTPETWRDWVSKKIIFQTVGTSINPPQLFFEFPIQPRKLIQLATDIGKFLFIPHEKFRQIWCFPREGFALASWGCWIDIMDIYRSCFGWAIFLL